MDNLPRFVGLEANLVDNPIATGPASIALVWNSPLPQSSLTTPSYTVQKKNSLADPSWTTVAAGIPSGGYTTTNMDTSANGDTAFYRVIWP